MDKGYESLDAEQKFAKVLVDLRAIRPFYSAVYEALERVDKTDSVDTMGVSTTQMIYNKNFVNKILYNEFLFVNLHEICHVALMHVSRRGRRDPILWNLACDLYVNKFLADEFHIEPGETDSSRCVQMPTDLCYCNTIDIDTDFAEHIYDEFEKQAKQNGYFEDCMDKTSGVKVGDNKKYTFSYTGTEEEDKNNGGGYYFSRSTKKEQYKTFNITLDTTFISSNDIIDNGEDDVQKENDNKRILSEAKTRYEMSNRAGDEHGLLKFKVDNILKSHIDWRKWLTKYCIKAKSSDSTFSNPDKRMFYQSAIYPGQAEDESNTIKNIKVCIDTSGSISDEDLQYIFGQILKLSKQFKIDAEVIAWDTSMTSCGKLTSNTDIRNVELEGRGGTDPTCLFEYFDSKKCKEKPIVTLVFTDGIWSMKSKDKWKKKYKDTLWIMTKHSDINFEPPFGLVTKVKYNQ